MKKFTNKFLKATADAALGAMIFTAGIPSLGGAYQPKVPANLKKVAESHKALK